MYFKLLHYNLPLEKGMKLHLNKVESHFPKNAKCKFGGNWPSGSGKDDFYMYFCYFTIFSTWKSFWTKLNPPSAKFGSGVNKLCYITYLPLEKEGPFIWTNLNPFDPRMLCAKFNWNWPCGSGEEDL